MLQNCACNVIRILSGYRMPNLQIRDLPQDLYEALKTDAKMEQRSLTQQAIVALREARDKRRCDQRKELLQTLRQSGRRFSFTDDAPETMVNEDRKR